jgi:hypothetical protein
VPVTAAVNNSNNHDDRTRSQSAPPTPEANQGKRPLDRAPLFRHADSALFLRCSLAAQNR